MSKRSSLAILTAAVSVFAIGCKSDAPSPESPATTRAVLPNSPPSTSAAINLPESIGQSSFDTAGRKPLFEADQSATSEERAARRKAAARPIDAEDVMAAYDSNDLAAAGRFDGKIFALAGRIGSIELSPEGVPFLTLYNSKPRARQTVFCVFAKADAGLLSRLKARDSVVIVGAVEGRSRGNVSVIKCSVVKVDPR